MMKRAISVVFSALLLLSALVVMNIIPVMNVGANDPTPMGGGLYITAGDWTVDGTSTLKSFTSGETVIVNGHLTVEAPQTLTFTGANLQMNPSFDGEFRITVESGANIIIQDVDNNPVTTADRSMVNSSNPANRYGFVVEGSNGQITMTNSELRDCGWEENSANDWRSSGLWVGTDNLLDAPEISGNEIHECVIGVTVFQNTVGADISDNDIHDCSFTGIEINQSNSVVVDNNDLTTCGNGMGYSYSIHAWSGIDNEITNNEVIYHQYFGIFLMVQSGVLIDGNTVRDAQGSGVSILLLGPDGDNYVSHNEIYNLTWHGIWVSQLSAGANVYVHNNTIHDIDVTDGTVALVQQNLDLGHLESIDNTIYNIDESVDFGDRNVGMTVHHGSGHIIARNDISTVSDHGVQIYADDVLFFDNDIYSNGDGVASVFGDDAGILISADNTTITNSRIYDNHPPFVPGSSDVNGIYIRTSSNTLIENTEISNNEVNIRGWGDGITSNDALIENCTITQGIWTNENFYLNGNSDFTVIHPNPQTWDNSTDLVSDVDSSLTLKWYLNVTVTRGGVPENGASVWVNATGTDSPDPSTGQPYTTATNDGDAGTVKWIPVTEYMETSTGKTDFTPHWVNVSSAGSVGLAYPTVWKSKDIVVDLVDLPEVLDLVTEGGATNVYRETSIKIRANAYDTEDAEVDLTPYFEYRVSDTSPWETTNFTGPPTYIGSAPSGYWEITFLPDSASPLGWYDFRVRIEDTYPTSSDWWVEDDLLEVLNNPPVVVSSSNTSGSALRDATIFVIADGSDVEDTENTLACEIQYRSPTGSWSGPDSTLGVPFFSSGNWRAEFTSQGTPTKDELGLYDFRFRFQDTDGDWSAWETNDDWIKVLNNPPQADTLDAGESLVYRNAPASEDNFVWLFANVTELEDPENQLTVLFEYFEPEVGWGSAYIDHVFTLSYDAGAGLWKVKFIPPDTAAVGFYNFRVTFTDLDGGSDSESANGLLTVMNNPPEAIDINPSQPTIRAGVADLLRIQVNADDIEDDESQLTIENIEWQYKGSSTWSSSWFGDVDYDATGGGHVWVEFEPPSTAEPGYYSFRVKVMDLDDDMSDPWLEIIDAVQVTSPQPNIEYVTPEVDEVYRGDQMTIRMKGDDVDPQADLIPHLEYRKKGASTWTEISGSTTPPATESGYWEVYWTPDAGLDEGQYEFQGRFENTENAFSDYEAGSLDVTVMNNVPTAIDIGIVGSATSVDRKDTVTLYANGNDEEDDEDQLTAYFEYEAPGDTWDNVYISGKTYNDADNRWEIDFEPEGDADLGDYSFRIYFKDTDNDESDPVVMGTTITVNNVKPIVEDLNVPDSALRGESITITANAADDDGTEGALIPMFEFKSPSGTYMPIPGSANYVSNIFRITWIPGAGEDVGQYSIRVRFSDGEEDSEWYEDTTTFTLENVEPEVDIDSPQRDEADVTFSATVTDFEDSPSDLTYDWNFGDGETSTEESPSHTYSESGSYDVTLTITDSDGDTDTDHVSITIPRDTTGKESEEGPSLYLWIIHIMAIIIVLLVLLVMWLIMGRRREDRIPPSVTVKNAWKRKLPEKRDEELFQEETEPTPDEDETVTGSGEEPSEGQEPAEEEETSTSESDEEPVPEEPREEDPSRTDPDEEPLSEEPTEKEEFKEAETQKESTESEHSEEGV